MTGEFWIRLNGADLVHPGGVEQIPTHSNGHYPRIENFASAVLDGTPLRSTGITTAWRFG